MTMRKRILAGIFSIIVAIVLLLQFTTLVFEQLNSNTTIVLEPYDGELSTTQIVYTYGTPITELPIPQKMGHTFDGWFFDETFVNEVLPGDVIYEKTNLYAKYVRNEYTITIFSEEGEMINFLLPFESDIDLSSHTERDGYTFLGWYMDEDFSTLFTLTDMVSDDLDIYGQWILNDYTIRYSLDGGVTYADITQPYDSIFELPNNPERQGYTFDGWYTDETYTTVYLNNRIPSEDTVVYPKWIPNTYTIYLNENGGSPLENLRIPYGNQVVLPDITRIGYDFEGWFIDTNYVYEYFEDIMPAEDLTLYAKWNVKRYTITYEEDGINKNIGVSFGNEIPDIPEPSKMGYSFGGWYLDEALTQAFIYDVMPAENLTLYPKWVIGEYVLNYVDYDGTVLYSGAFQYNDDLTGITVDTTSLNRIGYTFSGWNLDPSTMPAQNLNIVAQYSVNTYTLSFLDFDGTILYTEQFDFNEDLTNLVYPDGLTREGYTFIGWDITLPTTMPANDLNVTALYEVNSYFISFFDYDGSLLNTIEVNYGVDISSIIGPETPTRVGYSFLSWDQVLPNTMPANNLVLTAIYTVVRNTITFETNGGSEIEPLTSQEGQAIFAPDDPTKLGYVFDGWYADEALLTQFFFITTPPSDITIYAKWSPDTYQLIYQDFNGDVLSTQNVLFGDSLSLTTEPTEPIRDGYTFSHWDISLPSTMPASNVVLTAEYTINSYTLIFIDYDESVIKEESVLYGSDLSGYQFPVDPSRIGYTFIGWSYDLPSSMPNHGVVVTALYDINQYTISFVENGGSDVLDITDDYNVSINEPSHPTKTGYTFEGWYLDAEFNSLFTFTTMPAENITLYAKWTINQYTITFDTDGGTSIPSITADYGSSIIAPSNPEKTGYTFTGWDVLIPTTMPAGNLTITAQYSINSYQLEYRDYDGTVLYTDSFNYDVLLTSVLEPLDPNRIGYTFTGWDIELPNNMPANDLMITATYQINTYTLQFVDWNGSILQTADYNYDVSLSSVNLPNNPTRIGYTFIGWSSTVPTHMPAEDVIITAQYSINQYTISFVENGGSLVNDITQDFNTTVTQPTDPTKTGYTFEGWYSDAELNTLYTFTIMPSHNITLYAKWTINQYTITFNTDGGTSIASITADYGVSILTPENPDKVGYTFTGWDTLIPSTMPAQNQIITAQYSINSYTLEYRDYNGVVLFTDAIVYGTSLNTVSEPDDPVRVGYTFNGWNIELPSTMPAQDLILIATYVANTYTLEFVDWNGAVIQTASYNYNANLSSVGFPNDPNRSGYTFTGWDGSIPSTMPSQDVTITAQYMINQYTITFIENGGTLVSDITQNYGTSVSEPTAPTKEGYTFDGWYSDVELNTPYTFTTMPAENITLYAKWTINQYRITFDSNGGSIVDYIEQDYGTNVNPTIEPTKTSYIFGGWYTDNGTFLNEYSFNTMPSQNITLYAKWNAGVYTITFDSNGGSAVNSMTQAHSTVVSQPADPTKEGHTFDGWYTDDGTFLNNYTFTTMPSNNLTLYAKWNIVAYTISFNSHGGTSVSSITQDYGSVVIEPTQPIKSGYLFDGWYTDDGTFLDEYIFTTMPANNLTLYAKWIVNNTTISFIENGGTVVSDITAQEGTAVLEPTAPTKEGYTFDGWFSDFELTQAYTFTTMPAQNITLYAKWTVNTYTIEYLDWDSSVLQSTTYAYGSDISTVTPPSDPSRTGYTFIGWSDVLPDNMPANNISITAVYTINAYTLKYIDFDGTVLYINTFNYGAVLTTVTPPAQPSRTGYSFTGWDITKPTNMPANDVTITATYSINQYTIDFEENGGSIVSDITQNYGTSVNQPTDPTKIGYTFDGWYQDILLTQAYTFTTMPAENITLYAKWTINQYTINFEENGGTIVSDITQDYATIVNQPIDPSKTGYTFSGWYQDALLTQSYTFTTMPAENITLYAKWTANTHTLQYLDWNGSILYTNTFDYDSDLSGVTVVQPTRYGYTFTGWDIVLPTSMPDNDVTITAQYTINSFTLQYLDWDGTVLYTNVFDYNESLEGVIVQNPTRIGYSFTGWDYVKPTTMPNNDLSIQALYTINQYTITFDSNGGTSVGQITQDYGAIVTQPTNPTRIGYTFDGWFIDDLTFNTAYVFTTMPAENITLYAKWIVNTYTLEYLDWDGSTLFISTFNYGESLDSVSVTNPTRVGYTFSHWDISKPVTMPNNDVTITAQYTINQYTLSYLDWDGAVLYSNTFNYGSDLSSVIPPVNPSRMYYTFTGWDALLPSSMPSNDVTLNAQYTINQYTISFIENGGTIVSDITQDYGSLVNQPIDPTRTGYTFDGWYVDAALTIPYEFTTMPGNNITLYAAWRITQYTITFDSNGGTLVSSITGQEGTAITEPPEPTKPGYYFGGWYTDNTTFQNEYTFITMPPADLTLYARWLTSEELAQVIIDEIEQRIVSGYFQNLDVANKRTSSMEAAINAAVNDLLIMYPNADIQLINGTRSGSTYVFTFVVTVDSATQTIVDVTATFI